MSSLRKEIQSTCLQESHRTLFAWLKYHTFNFQSVKSLGLNFCLGTLIPSLLRILRIAAWCSSYTNTFWLLSLDGRMMLPIPVGLESNCQHLELQCELLELQLSKLHPGTQEHFLGFYWTHTFVDTAVQALREKTISLHASEPSLQLKTRSMLEQVKGRASMCNFIITFGLAVAWKQNCSTSAGLLLYNISTCSMVREPTLTDALE